jgi:hypothetical protein
MVIITADLFKNFNREIMQIMFVFKIDFIFFRMTFKNWKIN